jgi:hypothetical protein
MYANGLLWYADAGDRESVRCINLATETRYKRYQTTFKVCKTVLTICSAWPLP